MVRHAGLWACGNRAKLAECREWLGMAPVGEAEVLGVIEYLEQLGLKELTECPECGRRLVVAGRVEPTGLSPPEEERHAA